MSTARTLAAAGDGGPVLTIFAVFIVCIVLIAVWVGTDSEADGFFVGGRRLSSAQNGIALFGNYISAATLLGTPGLIALAGYDGIPYVLGPIVAWIVILLLVAEPLHSTGRFTIGDSLARRLRPLPVHRAIGVSTLVVSLLYLISQLVGAGSLAAPILGLSGDAAQNSVMVFLGVLMVIYVAIGGMRGATLVQCIKAVLLLACTLYMALLVLSKAGWNPSGLLGAAAQRSGVGEKFLQAGLRFGDDGASKLDSLSLQLALVLGAAGLPHLLMRLSVVPTARAARRSVQWTTVLTCVFCLTAGVLGFGAAAAIGPAAIQDDNPSGNTVTFLLADYLGGSFLLAVMSCIAFITILAVVAGVALASATSLAHDIYGAVLKRGRASEKQEVFVARISLVLIGAAATALAVFAQGVNVSFVAGLAFAVAASAHLPAILYSIYWKRFTTTGATWSIYGGLLSSILLALLSPAVSGNPSAVFPDTDFAAFPLNNPGIVSIPLGFFLGWLGTVLGKEEPDEAKRAETEVRAVAGAATR
ncbi:cation acetate symporter [Streptomyces sp. NPDC004647]|uniref:solute symporter family protein n=1 Tax=Streptomyces sp. NPDC004647 TaxID=3154671 RepID=UPI00339EFA36